MVKERQLKCNICSTEIEVPLCCDKEMQLIKGELKCMLCNTAKQIPICCGKENVMIAKSK